jgi:hypothetical protein
MDCLQPFMRARPCNDIWISWLGLIGVHPGNGKGSHLATRAQAAKLMAGGGIVPDAAFRRRIWRRARWDMAGYSRKGAEKLHALTRGMYRRLRV